MNSEQKLILLVLIDQLHRHINNNDLPSAFALNFQISDIIRSFAEISDIEITPNPSPQPHTLTTYTKS
jgi:hypothetical protein